MLRSLAWVGPLTILIWVYAEREQISTPTISDVPVNVRGVNVFVTAAQPTVSLELKGPQNGLDRVNKLLFADKPPGIQIDLANTPLRGHQRINVVDRIQNLPLFRDTGVSVTKSSPDEIEVDIDDLVDQSIPVVNPPGATDLETSSHYEPHTVNAHGPKTLMETFAKQGKLIAYAQLQGLGTLSPGHHAGQIVQVTLPDNVSNITLDPTTVKAYLDVRSPDQTRTIAAIPILITAPPNVLDDYEIQDVPASVTGTHVTGPPAQLDLMDKTLPTALLTIRGDDIGHEEPKQLVYQLPKDVTVDPADQARTFKFKLEKRPKQD